MVDQISQSGGAVLSALKQASRNTGVDFDFLYRMAQRESALDPSAQATTSSAAGLFQFIEQTWLGAVKKYGADHGLSAYANDIERGSDGRFSVSDATRRDAILNLRFNADKAASLAAELAQENKTGLEKRLGRTAGAGDLYAAHFLGVSGAAKLLSAPPDAKAADLLPAAANANKPVFFDAEGARSVADVIASIEKSMGAAVDQAKTLMRDISAGAATVTRTIAAEKPPVMQSEVKQIVPGKLGHSLSPLAIMVLQALDPTSLRNDKRQD